MSKGILLVTFCNQFYARSYTLGVVDLSDGNLRWHWWRKWDGWHGNTGICVMPFGYLIGYQYSSPEHGVKGLSRIMVLDKEMKVIQFYHCRHIRDIHSILRTPLGTFAVSSGNNAIYELVFSQANLIEAEKVYWAIGENLEPIETPVESDLYHVNSIAFHGGRLAVSMFGNAPQAGRVLFIDTNETLMEGLDQPHTLQSLDGELFVCDSKRGWLVSESGKRQYVGGYVRGLTWDDDFLYVGISAMRKYSKRSGIPNPEFDGKPESNSSYIHVLDRATMQPVRRFNMRHFGPEIYDLCVPDHPLDPATWEDNGFLRNVAIEDRFTELEDHNTRLQSRITELQGIEDRFTELKDDNSRLQSRITELQGMEHRFTELQDDNSRLQSRITELQGIEHRFGALEDHKAHLEAHISELQGRVSDLERTYGGLQHERAELQRSYDAELARLYGDLHVILNSVSWKITAPLRRFYDWLKG